jgi:hypothetical protein
MEELLYRPALQSEQLEDPLEAAYFPEGHAVHAVEPETEDFPAAQLSQADDAEAAVVPKYFPVGQAEHDDDPVVWA